jgi:hypothetical protein
VACCKVSLLATKLEGDRLRRTGSHVADRGAKACRCPGRCLRRSDSVAASVPAREELPADELT